MMSVHDSGRHGSERCIFFHIPKQKHGGALGTKGHLTDKPVKGPEEELETALLETDSGLMVFFQNERELLRHRPSARD